MKNKPLTPIEEQAFSVLAAMNINAEISVVQKSKIVNSETRFNAGDVVLGELNDLEIFCLFFASANDSQSSVHDDLHKLENHPNIETRTRARNDHQRMHANVELVEKLLTASIFSRITLDDEIVGIKFCAGGKIVGFTRNSEEYAFSTIMGNSKNGTHSHLEFEAFSIIDLSELANKK